MVRNPDYAQIIYDRTMAAGLPGLVRDGNPAYLSTFVAESDIPFGRVISVGSKVGEPVSAILGGGSQPATAGYLVGYAVDVPVASFTGITTGAITFTIDGTDRALSSLDFSSCTDLADVAAVINTALSTYGTCVYDTTVAAFKVTSATTGSSSTVRVKAPASGVDIRALIGMDANPVYVDGIAARTAVTLGISIRSLTVQAQPAPESNITLVRPNEVGVYCNDGQVLVQVMDSVASRGAAVYYHNTTGQIYATSGGSMTRLGSATFTAPAAAGAIVAVDLVGLR